MSAEDYKTVVDTGERIEAEGDRAATSVEARDLLKSKQGMAGLFIVRAKMDTFISQGSEEQNRVKFDLSKFEQFSLVDHSKLLLERLKSYESDNRKH